jgi:arginine deiminase
MYMQLSVQFDRTPTIVLARGVYVGFQAWSSRLQESDLATASYHTVSAAHNRIRDAHTPAWSTRGGM